MEKQHLSGISGRDLCEYLRSKSDEFLGGFIKIILKDNLFTNRKKYH